MKRLVALLILIFMVFSSTLPFLIKNDSDNIEIEEITLESEPQIIVIKIIKSDVEIATENAQKELEEINNISDKKEWFVAYKNIIDKYSYILDPPETIYDYYTDEELDMFFRVVQAEIGDEYTFEQKCNVASVILNRIDHYKFSDEMLEILTPQQFETVKNGSYKNVKVSEDTILACEYAFEIEDTTGGCLFFDSNNTLNYEFVFNDGAHNFYKYKRKEFQEYVQEED